MLEEDAAANLDDALAAAAAGDLAEAALLFIAAVGVPRLTRLKTLETSPRSWNFSDSWMLKVRKSEASTFR